MSATASHGGAPRVYRIRNEFGQTLLSLTTTSDEPSRFRVHRAHNVDNYDVWGAIATRGMRPLAFIREHLAKGVLTLERIHLTPTNRTHIETFDCTAIAVTAIGEEEITTPYGPLPQVFDIIDPCVDEFEHIEPVRRVSARLQVKDRRTVGPAVFIAHAEKAHETVQCLGVFHDASAAEKRCRERTHADEDKTVAFDRWWFEEWLVDGDYVQTYDMLPDGGWKTHL